MGNSSSVPERIYKAARANDVNELQGLCRDMRLNGALDAATKRSWLNWADAEGRTALHHACQRNYLQVAQILLDEGADLHLVAPKRANGGSPLAEAVAGKHEALVELLLRYGADPFTENRAGKAPLDLALELKAVNILRSFERHALFAGYVNMKVLQLKGFSHAAKDRWVVVAPRFSPPSEGSGGVGIVRIMMLVYRNAAEAEPRTKCWLDGASIFRAGQEAVLRLHANHEQPRNAFTKYDNGWMLFFKQASTSYSTPASAAAAGPTGGAGAASITAGAAATYAAFMAVCFRPLDHLQAQQQLRASGAAPIAVSNPFGNPAPISSGSGTAAASPGAAFNPWWQQQQQQQQQQQRPAVPSLVASGSGSVPTSPTGFSTSPMSPFTQQQQQQYQHAGLSMQPAGAPPQAAQQRPPGQQPWPQDAMHAQPGETDEQFARRLAVMMGGGGSGSNSSSPTSSGRLPSAAATMPNSRLGSSSSQQLLQPQQQQQQGLYPSLSAPCGGLTAGLAGDAEGPAPSAPPAAAGLPLTSANPFRPSAAAAAASTAGPQQQPGLAPGVAAVAATSAGAQLHAGSIAGAQQMSGLAGSSASAAAAGATGGSESAGDQDLCVICLVEAREVGFLHGASVHKCVCRECASLMQPHAPCPMCRQPIERIIGVY